MRIEIVFVNIAENLTAVGGVGVAGCIGGSAEPEIWRREGIRQLRDPPFTPPRALLGPRPAKLGQWWRTGKVRLILKTFGVFRAAHWRTPIHEFFRALLTLGEAAFSRMLSVHLYCAKLWYHKSLLSTYFLLVMVFNNC